MPSKASGHILFFYFETLVILLLVQLKKETLISICIFTVCVQNVPVL